MSQFVLQCPPSPQPASCALCHKAIEPTTSLQICHSDSHTPVCDACARRSAPSLAALSQLAAAAERIGRIQNHSVFPPLGALLELAQAAENFTCSLDPQLRQAG